MKPEEVRALEESYAARGVRCEVELGERGVVVYASTRVDAERVAREVLRSARGRPDLPRAVLSPAARDDAEPPETRWWAMVEFDGRRG